MGRLELPETVAGYAHGGGAWASGWGVMVCVRMDRARVALWVGEVPGCWGWEI